MLAETGASKVDIVGWSRYLLTYQLLRARCHRYSPAMTAARRVLIAVRVVLSKLELVAVVIALCLPPVFHTWLPLDVTGAAYVVLLGTRQSLALRSRRRAQRRIAGQRR